MPRCRVEAPPLVEIAPGHKSACHLNEVAVV
jgi:peptide/nickel transport system ATP-binding protein